MGLGQRCFAIVLMLGSWQASAQKKEDVLFPDWGTESFDVSVGPILGVRARQTEINGVKSDVISSEAGLAARIAGIPLWPGNPGATVQPYASYTWGNRTEKLKGADLDATESSGFQRSWIGVLGRVYYKSFRYSLDVGGGKILHDKDYFIDLSSRRIVNDFGLMILPFLSAHYTISLLTVTLSGESDPSIEELDHWVHGRISFSLFSSQLDFGPGVTTTTFSARATPETAFEEIAKVRTSYLKAVTSMTIFWRLGASGSAKYVLKGENEDGLSDTIEQLPSEGLSQRKSVANLPDGSLEATAFFGIRNMFAGFGVGWQYYYLEQKTEPKEIVRNQGFAVVYDADF